MNRQFQDSRRSLFSNTKLALATLLSLALFLANGAMASAEICGGLDYAGQCEGTVIQWCENDEVIQLDCADHGAVCGWDADHEYYTCMDPEEMTEDCLTENSYSGSCQNGTTVVWCNSDGTIDTMTCKDGLVCGWNDQMGYFDCVSVDDTDETTEDVPTEFGAEDPPTDEGNAQNVSENIDESVTTTTAEPRVDTGAMNEPESSNPLAPPPSEPAIGCQQAHTAPSGAFFILMMMCLVGLWVRRVRN